MVSSSGGVHQARQRPVNRNDRMLGQRGGHDIPVTPSGSGRERKSLLVRRVRLVSLDKTWWRRTGRTRGSLSAVRGGGGRPRINRSMAVRIGPLASPGREPRQARKGAAAAADAGAGVWLVRAASPLDPGRAAARFQYAGTEKSINPEEPG